MQQRPRIACANDSAEVEIIEIFKRRFMYHDHRHRSFITIIHWRGGEIHNLRTKSGKITLHFGNIPQMELKNQLQKYIIYAKCSVYLSIHHFV